MKIFTFIILVFAIFACSWADETCSIDGKILMKGETHQPAGKCVIMECTDKGTLFGKTCPLVARVPSCSIVPGDLSKAYPNCCETFDCKPGK